MPLGRPVPPALSSNAPTTWPLILPGDDSFRSTLPTLPPAAGELLQAIGQVLGPGHGRAVDEDRDDPNARSSAASISMRTKSWAYSRRRWFRASALEAQLAPITATRASHLPTCSARTSTKSSPSSMLSTSKKEAFASQSSHEAVINAPREAARIVSLMKTPPQHIDALAPRAELARMVPPFN